VLIKTLTTFNLGHISLKFLEGEQA